MPDVIGPLRKLYAIANNKHRTSRQECIDSITGLITQRGAPGIAFGEVHGDYAYARFMCELIPHLSAIGVTRFYTEIMHQKHQSILDRWQETGHTAEMVRYFNSFKHAHAEDMWQEYWNVLQAADRNGMKIMAIDPDRYRAKHPRMHIMDKSISWQQFIDADQKKSPAPYILYCGERHLQGLYIPGLYLPPSWGLERLSDYPGSSVTEMLEIPGIYFRHGPMGFHPSPLSGQTYHCWILPAWDQTPIREDRKITPRPIPYVPA